MATCPVTLFYVSQFILVIYAVNILIRRFLIKESHTTISAILTKVVVFLISESLLDKEVNKSIL